MRKIATLIGLALPALASLIIASLLSVAPTQAARHKTLEQQLAHYQQCLIWLYSDPVRHAKHCGPGHEFFFNPNINSAPYTPPLPVEPACPTHEHHWGPYATVDELDGQFGAEVLLTTGSYGGYGGYGGDHDGCKPDKPSCPTSWIGPSSGPAPSILAVGFSYGCPKVCTEAYFVAPDGNPGIILARREGYGGSWGECNMAYEVKPLQMPQLLI